MGKKCLALVHLSCIWHEILRIVSLVDTLNQEVSTLLLRLLFHHPLWYLNYNGFRMGGKLSVKLKQAKRALKEAGRGEKLQKVN